MLTSSPEILTLISTEQPRSDHDQLSLPAEKLNLWNETVRKMEALRKSTVAMQKAQRESHFRGDCLLAFKLMHKYNFLMSTYSMLAYQLHLIHPGYLVSMVNQINQEMTRLEAELKLDEDRTLDLKDIVYQEKVYRYLRLEIQKECLTFEK